MNINSNITKKILKLSPYFYAPAITMFIILFIFIRKGVYPFGEMTIDCMDMGQVNAPMYHHIYDALHGTKSLFFDWYTAYGINMAESVSIISLLSPFNLFFYFIPRDYILQSLSIFIMIKMMAMASAMFVFLHKKYQTNVFWKVLFSLCYAFSGFVLQYYGNSQWLDIAVLFPLLILAVYHLLDKNRIIPYIVVLTSCLIINFYNSAMILMFLFFVGGLYFILIAPKDRRKQQILSFGIGTISAIGLSMITILPAYIQMSQSVRLEGNETIVETFLNILNKTNYANYEKWYMLFGTALLMVIIIKGIINTRKDKKTTLFIIGSILIVLLQIYFENINLIWHGGSYKSFPIRFGYMISFVLISAACYYIPKIHGLNELNNDKNIRKVSFIYTLGKIILGLIIIAVITYSLVRIYWLTFKFDYRNTLFSLFTIAFVIMLVFYTIILHKSNRFINYSVVSITLISTLILGTYIFIAPDSKTLSNRPERSSDFVYTANELKEELNIADSQLDRIKNIGNTLNSNYPFILKRPGLTNFTHTVSSVTQQNFRNLGYATHYTLLLDSGGTVFTDALFNVKHTLATYELDEDLYTLIGGNGLYKLYENDYILPFGLIIPDDITRLDEKYENSFDYQNALFESITGQKNLISPLLSGGDISSDLIEQTSNSANEIEYTIQVNGNQALYLYTNGNVEGITFYMQDEIVPIPSVGQENNTQYPAMFNKNIVSLGAFSNQTINLRICCTKEITSDKIGLGLLDLEKLKSLTDSYDGYTTHETSSNRGVTLTVTSNAEKNMLFLPITYDKGWSCTVNEQKADILPVAGTFMGIYLENGENNVSLSFIPHGIKAGAFISLVTLLFLITGFLIKKKTQIILPVKLMTLVETLYYIAWASASTLVYIVPVVYTIFRKLIFNL